MICIIVLGACGMQVFILLLVIGFLEQDVSTNAGFLELAIIFHGGCGNVDIHPANRTVLVFDRIDGLNALQHILNGTVYRVFTGFQRQTLMAHILQSNNFLPDFFLCQLAAGDMLIFVMIWTVQTSIDAVVGQIQRSKNYNSVAIKSILNFCRTVKNPLNNIWVFTQQQQNSFPVAQTLMVCTSIKNLVN